MHMGIRSVLLSHFICFSVCLVFILFACFVQTSEQKTGLIIFRYLWCGSIEIFTAFLFTASKWFLNIYLAKFHSIACLHLVSFSTMALQDWDSAMLSLLWVQGGFSWSITPETPGRLRGGRSTLIGVLVCKCYVGSIICLLKCIHITDQVW